MNIPKPVKKLVSDILRPFGLKLVQIKPQTSPEAALGRMLTFNRIDTVLDVGANEGQYANLLRKLGFAGRIISFEPWEPAHRRLQSAAKRDSHWTIAPRCALGNEEGQICLNVSSNDGLSSSVLPMLDAHRRAAPDVITVGSEVVPITRLDTALHGLLPDEQRVFLKLDVHGYELEVLRGATKLFSKIVGAQLELCLVPLWQGQPLFGELTEFMLSEDYSMWGLLPGLADNSTGRLLQVDAIFFRDGCCVSPSEQ